MRYRRIKYEIEKLEAVKDWIVEDGKAYKGKWAELFGNSNPIHLEMGCGKGKFINELAQKNPNINYIAVEGQEGVVLRAAEKAKEKDIKNIKFIRRFIQDIYEYFSEDEISRIYLNFSDPWPKDRHSKRRLTHKRYIDKYRYILKGGGEVEFKTDNDGLFDFSVLEFKENDYNITEITYDLHSCDYEAKNITTEYEEKFKKWGHKIKYLKASPIKK